MSRMVRSIISVVLVVSVPSLSLAGTDSVFSSKKCIVDEESSGRAANSIGSLELLGACLATSISPVDTIESIDEEIVFEEGRDRRKLYGEIAAAVIVVAAVGYAVYLMIGPSEEEKPQNSGGKPVPMFFRIPLFR